MVGIKKLNQKISRDISIFHRDLINDLLYLESFPSPVNKIQRSYYQYKCQIYNKSIFKILMYNMMALIVLFPIIVFLISKGFFRIKKRRRDSIDLAVNIYAGVKNIIPNSLNTKFDSIKQVDFGQKFYLILNDLILISKLSKYLYSPVFVLKCIYKIAMYRAVINEFNPCAIICSSEYSYTSSVLTWFCHKNNIIHINVMHGEKLLYIRDSFFEFDECYVWDEHYVDLFKKLRAAENQFIVDAPPSLYIQNRLNTGLIYELTYYLGGETIEEMKKIKEVLFQIKVPHNQICIRPHPRYSNIESVKIIFNQFIIEDSNEVSIVESFNKTNGIASLYSTVLYQGYVSGKKIIIDDVSQKEKFRKLNDLNFIIFSKPYIKMSALLN